MYILYKFIHKLRKKKESEHTCIFKKKKKEEGLPEMTMENKMTDCA